MEVGTAPGGGEGEERGEGEREGNVLLRMRVACIGRRIDVLVVLFRLLNASLVWTQFDPDEFWQAHEAAHRLAFGYGHRTWEWTHAIRSHAHVLPLALTIYLLRMLRLDSPAAVAWAPRAVQAIASGAADLCLRDFSAAYFGSASVGNMTLICSLCCWFTWYAGVRAYSSSMEATLICVIAKHMAAPVPAGYSAAGQRAWWHLRPRLGSALIALTFLVRPSSLPLTLTLSLVLGLSASTRYQMLRPLEPTMTAAPSSKDGSAQKASTGAPTGLHCVAEARDSAAKTLLSEADASSSTVDWAALCFPAVAVVCVVTLIDCALYNRLVLPAIGFLRFNLQSGAGASEYYGTHPWHWYVVGALPAILAAQAPLLALGVRAATPRQRWLLAPPTLLLLMLSSRPHKELRFLLPVLPFAFCFCGRALAGLGARHRTTVLVIIASTNAPIALYLSMVHQRAPVAVMAALRSESVACSSATQSISVDLLTRCHQTPGHAFLHGPNVTLSILDCAPPSLGFDAASLAQRFPEARGSRCTNDCDCFFAAPGAAIRRRMRDALRKHAAPSHVVLFDELLANAEVSRTLRKTGFREVLRFFHAIEWDGWDGWSPGWRFVDLVLLRRRGACASKRKRRRRLGSHVE